MSPKGGDGQCGPDGGCANIRLLQKDVEAMKTQHDLERGFIERTLQRLEMAVAEIPRNVAEEIDREHAETKDDLKKGSAKFTDLYTRTQRTEKAVIAIYIVVGLVVLGKGFAWVWGFFQAAA